MTGRAERTPGPRARGLAGARWRAADRASGGPWQWSWRRRRRRRLTGCLLWLVTLLLVLLVLSILFGGFRTGTKVGDGPPQQTYLASVG